MTFLQLGERGLKDVRREVRALGLDFDSVDAGQVEAANDAMLKLQTVMQGVGNTIAIGLSPFITKASDKMLNFIKVSGGIKQIVRNGIQPLSEGLAKVFDILELVKVGWNFMSVGAKVALAGLLTPVAFLEEKVADLLRSLGQDVPETSSVGDFVEKLLEGATDDIDEMNKALDRFKRGANSTEMTEFFRRIQKEARLASEEVKQFDRTGTAVSGTSRRREFLKKKGAKDSKGREFITVDLKNISLKGAGESSGKSTEDKILDENKKSTKFLMAIAAQGVAGRGNARPTAQ